jgi:hypothetical protein
MNQASAKGALLFDANWRASVASDLADLKQKGQHLENSDNPPQECQELNTITVSIGGDLVYVSDEIAAGIDTPTDTPDAKHMQNASARMAAARPRMDKAASLVTAIMQRYSQ